jgi:hypothetical protein
MSIWTIRLKADLTDIATEVLDNISEGPVLDLAIGGGQFVSLAEQRQSPDSVFGCEELNSDITYAKKTKNLRGNYKTSKPTEVMELMTNTDISKINIVGNWPFTSGIGRAPVPVDIARNLKKHGYPKTLSVILQSGFLHSNDSGLSELRQYLFDAGLYKIKFNKKDLFKESGATVRTVTVFCKAGYTGTITVVNSKTKYDFDFRKVGYIVDGGTKTLTEFLVGLKEKNDPLLGYTTKHKKDIILNKASEKPKQGYVPFQAKMSKAGDVIQYAPRELFSQHESVSGYRVTAGYRPSGLEMGDPRIGLTSIVDPGTYVLHSPQICFTVGKDKKDADSLICYLHNEIVENFILPKTRTSPTLDCKKKGAQTKFLPRLPLGTYITSTDDVKNFLNISDELFEEIKQNYEY